MEDAQQVAVLDGAEIARRVEALLPEIEARADEIAEARRLPRDLVDALKTAGVFRMSMPAGLGRLSVAAAGPGAHRGVVGVRRSECRLVRDDRLRQRVLLGVPRRRFGPRVVDRCRRHHRRMAVPRWAGRGGGRRLSGVGAVEVRQRLHPRRRHGRWVHRDERQRRAGLRSRRHACRAHRCRPGRSLRGHRHLAHDWPRRQRKQRLRLQGPVRAGRAHVLAGRTGQA